MRKIALGSLALVGVAVFGWTGCQASKSTELVAGVSTQVQVPRDVKSIRIDVSVGGTPAFCQAYTVYDGHVELPRTLGTLPAHEAGTAVTITVSAFTVDTDSSLPALSGGCTYAPRVGGDTSQGGGAKVLRVSRQPYSQDEILFVPMPLKYACFDVDCGAGEDMSCKAGQCVASDTDTTKLVAYDDSVLFGKDATCFSVFGETGCFADIATVPAVTVDDASCTYAIPGAMGGPQLPAGVVIPQPPSGVTLPLDGLNVRVLYDSGITKEILDLDKDEGFYVPDSSTPQVFKLADGLCQMVHGTGTSTHRITSIEVSPVCRPKLSSQSICAADALAIVGANSDGTAMNPSGSCSVAQLQAATSTVEFVVDPTVNAADFLSAAGAIVPKLADPGLKNLKIGLQFIPDAATQAACPSTPSSAQIAMDDLSPPALTSSSQLLTEINNLSSTATLMSVEANNNTGLNVTTALQKAYADLVADTAVTKSIIVVTSGGLLSACPSTGGGQTPLQVITGEATANPPIAVNIVEITNTAGGIGCANSQLSSAVGAGNCIPIQHGTDSSTKVQEAILSKLTSAAACTYKVSGPAPDAVWFTDPTNPSSPIVSVKSPTATTADACRKSGSGWFADANNLVLCASTCTQYQTALGNATALATATAAATDGGTSSGSKVKLPTIIPLFAMTGDACIPPQGSTTGTGGGSDGGTSGMPDASVSKDSGSDMGSDGSAPVTCGAAMKVGASMCTGSANDNVSVSWQCGATTYATVCQWPFASPTPSACSCVVNAAPNGKNFLADFPDKSATCSTAFPTSDFDTGKILADCGFPAPGTP